MFSRQYTCCFKLKIINTMDAVRCYSCNNVVAKYYTAFAKMRAFDQIPVCECFEILNIKRYCCRRMFLGCLNDHDDHDDNKPLKKLNN